MTKNPHKTREEAQADGWREVYETQIGDNPPMVYGHKPGACQYRSCPMPAYVVSAHRVKFMLAAKEGRKWTATEVAELLGMASHNEGTAFLRRLKMNLIEERSAYRLDLDDDGRVHIWTIRRKANRP
jgi:hypothetical protein